MTVNSPVKPWPQNLFFGAGVLVLLCSAWLLFRFGTGRTAFLTTMQLNDPRGTAGQWFGTTVLLMFVLFSGLGLYWFWRDVMRHTKAFQKAYSRWETFKTDFETWETYNAKLVEKKSDPTQEAATGDPTQEAAAEVTTQQATAEVPAQEATAKDPTQEATAKEPTQEATAKEPTQEANAKDPAQEATAQEPTQEANAKEPAQEATAQDPAQEAIAKDPTQAAATGEPPPKKPDPEELIRNLKEDVENSSRLRRAVYSWTDPSPNSDAEMLIEGVANRCRQKLNLLQAVASILVLIGLVGNFFGLSKAVQELPNLMPTQTISEKSAPNVSSTTIKTRSGYTQTVKSEDPAQQSATSTAQGTVRSISDGLSVVVVSSVFGIGGMIFMLLFVAVFRMQFNHLVGEEVLLLAVEIGPYVRPPHSISIVEDVLGQLKTHLTNDESHKKNLSGTLTGLDTYLANDKVHRENLKGTLTGLKTHLTNDEGHKKNLSGTLTGLNAYLANDAKHKTDLNGTLAELNIQLSAVREQKDDVTTLSGQLEGVLRDHLNKEDAKFVKFSDTLDGLRGFLEARNEALSSFLSTAAGTGAKMDSIAGNLEKVAGSLVNMVETHKTSATDLSVYAETVKKMAEEDQAKSEQRHTQLVDKLSEKLTGNLSDLTSRFDEKLLTVIDEARQGEVRSEALVSQFKEQFFNVSTEQRQKFDELIQSQNQTHEEFKTALATLQEDSTSQAELLVSNLTEVNNKSTEQNSELLKRLNSFAADQRSKWDGLENAISERFAQKLQHWLDEAKTNRDSTDKLAKELIETGDSRNQVLVDKLIEQFASVSTAQRQKFEELIQLQTQSQEKFETAQELSQKDASKSFLELREQAAAQATLLKTCLKQVVDGSSSSFSGLTAKLELQLAGVTEAFQRGFAPLQHWLEDVAKSSQEQQELLAEQAKDIMAGLQSANLSHEQQAQTCRDILFAGQQALDTTRLKILELQDQWHVSLEGVAQELSSRWHEQQAQETSKLETVLTDHSSRIVSALDALQAREAQTEVAAQSPPVDFSRLESLLAEQTQLLTAALERGQFHKEEPGTTDWAALENLLAAHSQHIVAAVEMDKDALRAVLNEQAEKVVTAFQALQAATPPTTNGSIDYARLDSTLGEQAQRIIAALESRAPMASREAPELTPILGQLAQMAKKTNESLENLHRTLSEGYQSPCSNCGLYNSGRTEYCTGCGESLKQANKPPVVEQERLAPMFSALQQSTQKVEALLRELLTSRPEATPAQPVLDPGLLSKLDQSVRDLTERLRNVEIPVPPSTQIENVGAVLDQVGRLTAVLEAYLEESKSRKKGWFG